MTVVALIRRARDIGLTLEPQGADCLMVRGRPADLEAMKDDIIANKSAILAILGEEHVFLGSDAVAAAERIVANLNRRAPRRQRRGKHGERHREPSS